MAAPTGSRTLRASTSQMRCKTTMLRQNLFVYIMMSSGLSTNTEHWQVVEFIAPSLPILVDSAVDAHATRAPAPFYSKGRLVYGTTCVRKSMTEWSFASGDSMMRLRGDRTQCGRRGRGGRERSVCLVWKCRVLIIITDPAKLANLEISLYLITLNGNDHFVSRVYQHPLISLCQASPFGLTKQLMPTPLGACP